MASARYNSLVLDLGGVLAFYSPKTDVAGLPSRQITNALDSPGWHEYERGKTSQQECYGNVTSTFGIDPVSWKLAMEQMMDGLRPNADLIYAVKRLKQNYPKLRVYCLSNIPRPESERFRGLIQSWGIVDEFYASSAAGHRKPNVALYRHFLEKSGSVADDCIFVDDTIEHVVTAKTLGFRAILFKDTETVIRTLHNLMGDPVARGMAYLKSNAQNLFCETTAGKVQPDNYSQLLILQNTGDRYESTKLKFHTAATVAKNNSRSLVSLQQKGPTWNYFIGPPVFADTVYPDDSDTTSLAMTVLEDVSAQDKEVAMDKILSNLSPDGLPYCWFDKDRPRFCHCICANVFRFFYLNNCSERLPLVYSYLCRLLRTEAYLLGTRYYASPDWFLFILADLCAKRPCEPGLQEMRHLLVLRVQERIGCDRTVLGASMRLLSAQAFGLGNKQDLHTILDSQELDGGWERSWLWHYGKEPGMVGSRGVVTAMAVNGIQESAKVGELGSARNGGH